ncbi:MAG: Gfo/Idh/MocA family oxidoreductase [Betaproteobacteria bacterium]|nr:Gfo/Idh/MocA family oxidoreductase [Betaproteobacteria bacterium]
MLRAAIVGLGSWGRTLVTSVQGKCEDIRFTAGYTRTPGKAEPFCRQNNIRLAGSLEELLTDVAIDAVILATPNSQHEGQIQQAARAGKHVFVEKPIALDRGGAQAAIRVTQDAGVILAVGFNRRFHPSIRELRKRVKSGQLGAIGSIIAELTATTAFYRSSDSWRVDPKEEPAGAMAGVGVHLVDGMIDIIGRIREVYCVVQQRADPHGEDTTSLLVNFENGVTGLAFCSLAAARNFRMAVYGSKGFAEVLTPTMDVFRFTRAVEGRASHLARIPDAEEIATPGFNSTTEELAQFARCILSRQPYPVPLGEVLHGACVFDAAVESARIRQPVMVSDAA